jgi:hypothetical protein
MQVSDGLYAEVPLCASGPIARRVFGSFLTARMGVSVGRQVGRVRVFEEFLAVFNCSVLTFWSAIKFHRE